MKPEKYITQYKELARTSLEFSVKEILDFLVKNNISPEEYENVLISSEIEDGCPCCQDGKSNIVISFSKQIPNSNFENEEQAYLAELALQKEQENQRKKEEKAYQDSMNAKRAYKEFSRTKRIAAKSAGRNV